MKQSNGMIELFEELLNKMKTLNITEGYPHFSKNGVVFYLKPCQKANTLLTKKDIEEMIQARQNNLLKDVQLCND